jgi:hypothetical protein
MVQDLTSTEADAGSLASKLGFRLRSRLFRRRSRSGLHRRVRRAHDARSATGRRHRSRTGRRHRSTTGRGRSTAARSRRRTSHRSATARSRSAAATAAGVPAATAMVMMVRMMMMAAAAAALSAAAATAAAVSATTAAATLVREQPGGRWAWSGDQERRSGHHGRKQSLAKHQRSPQSCEVLRRVNLLTILCPWNAMLVGVAFRASFKKTRFDPQIARPAVSVVCESCAEEAM